MFKPTAPQLSRVRIPLTTKSVNKGYYKGNRTGSMGAHTPHGKYVIDWRKVRTYVCPKPEELKDFHLTPFVTKDMEKTKFMRQRRSEETSLLEEVEVERLTGRDFLDDVAYEAPEELSNLDSPDEELPATIWGQTWEELPEEARAQYKTEKHWEHTESIKERKMNKWLEKQGIDPSAYQPPIDY